MIGSELKIKSQNGDLESLLTISYTKETNMHPVLVNHKTSVPGILHAITITGPQGTHRMEQNKLK